MADGWLGYPEIDDFGMGTSLKEQGTAPYPRGNILRKGSKGIDNAASPA